ncbi:MAG: hypothetical protein ABIY55_33035 [Kofleriaceae bacterium]
MLGVVTDHAAPEHEPLPQRSRVHAARALAAEALSGQPERITHRGPDEQPSDSIHARRHSSYRADAILACTRRTSRGNVAMTRSRKDGLPF